MSGMTKKKWLIFLISNPHAALVMGWKLLGALAESYHYNQVEKRRADTQAD